MYLRLTTFTKKTSPKCHFTYYMFCYFYFALGLNPVTTLLTAGALIISPVARNSFKCVHDWCKGGWRRSGAPPPNKNPGYSGGSASRLLSWSFLSHVAVCILNAYSVNTVYGPFLLKLPYYHQKMYLVFDIFCFYKFYIFLLDNGQVYLSLPGPICYKVK